MSAVNQLKRAARSKDAKLAGQAVEALRLAGHTYRDCYRIALAGDPTLTENEWESLMYEADSAS
jgi:hypothetical protein